ncbi:DUF1697 domain-containing protein [Paenibacillus oryzisoli]|uniref:DUF1697 domain-containing protein n=1 Tax=Paenibacillus oryzisoli TaxID=1850517 RepID=UPI003D2B0D28
MSVYIALLRGINVSGQKSVKMDRLRQLFEGLGYTDVATYIQSGNVVFRAGSQLAEGLESTIHEALLAQLGYDIPVLVRTPAELRAIVAGLPWPLPQKGAASEPQVYVTLLAQPPSEAGLAKLQGVQSGEDAFVVVDRTVYVLVRQRYGDTKLSNQTMEKKLGVSATTRNWETINRLIQLAEATE